MRSISLLTFILVLAFNSSGQNQKITSTSQQPCQNPILGAACHTGGDIIMDGSGTLGMTYSNTSCGLNYVQTSVMTTTRYSPPGTGFPCTLNITGIPCGATGPNIIKAFVWYGCSNGSPNTNFTFNGMPQTSTLIGTGVDKCWSMGGTENYRGDVTAAVTGNGSFTFSSPIGAGVDGVTMMVIYADPNATYQGTIQINDGAIVDASGSANDESMVGLNVCDNSSYGNAFLIVGDMQDNVAPPTHTSTLNGTATSFPNLFWNFDVANTFYTAGQTTSAFGVVPDGGGDCYDWVLKGVYYQTTTCVTCSPPSGLPSTSSSTNSTCGNCDGTATVNPSGGVLPYTYSWNTVPVQNTQTATNLCAGNYIVTYTDASCLQGIDTITVGSSGGPPPPVITAAGPFCTTSPALNLFASPVGGTWSGTGITNAATGTFNPAIAGVGTFSIIYTDSASCGGNDSISIVVNLNDNATITPAGPFCASDPSTILSAVDPGGVWSGNGITNPATGAFNPTTAGAGTHTITYGIPGGCGDTATISILVIPDADATITPSGPYCFVGAAVNLTAVDPNGTWIGTGITNSTLGTFDPSIAGVGTHIITYTIAGACGDVQTTTIVVNPQDDATIFPAGPFCANDPSSLLSAATAGGVWSGNGITNSTSGIFNPTNAGPGNHTITYTTSGACGNTDTEVILVNPLPVVDFSVNTLSLCEKPALPFTFSTDTTSGLFGSILWDFGDGNTSNLDTIKHTYAYPGTYNVSLTLTSSAAAGGCINDTTKNAYVTVYANPIADFTMNPNPVSMFNPTINFHDQSTAFSQLMSWYWNIGGLTTSASNNPIYNFPEDTGHYLVSLIVTDDKGCEDTISKIAIVTGEFGIYIPNAFTPDGDNVNDGFFPDGFGISDEEYSFFIFDRWGEIIFESHAKFRPWNGTYKGKLVENGMYVWKLIFRDINGKVHTELGHVTIIK